MEYNVVKSEKQDPKISVKSWLKDKLDKIGKKNETYHNIINRLVENNNGDS